MLKGIIIITFGLLTIGFGICARKYPTFGWRLGEGWKVKGDSEPSAAYIDYIKFAGTFTISAGSLFIVFGILNLL